VKGKIRSLLFYQSMFLKAYHFIFLFVCALHTPAVSNSDHDHDIHLSLCELRYNEQSAAFEVAIKIFIDDLETAIGKEGITKLGIGTSKEGPLVDEYISAYLDKNFTIEIDGIKLKASFVGKELTDDMLAVWCYVEYPVQKKQPQKCILTNRVLFEIYDDQRNIMDIKMNKSHKDYTIFERGSSSWSYTY